MRNFFFEVQVISFIYALIILYMVQIRLDVQTDTYVGLRSYFLHTALNIKFSSFVGRITICFLWPIYLLAVLFPRFNNLFCYIWDTEYLSRRYARYDQMFERENIQYTQNGYRVQMVYGAKEPCIVAFYRKDSNASVFRIVAGWLPFSKGKN